MMKTLFRFTLPEKLLFTIGTVCTGAPLRLMSTLCCGWALNTVPATATVVAVTELLFPGAVRDTVGLVVTVTVVDFVAVPENPCACRVYVVLWSGGNWMLTPEAGSTVPMSGVMMAVNA